MFLTALSVVASLSGLFGGVIYSHNSSLILTNNTFSGNVAQFLGRVLMVHHSTLHIVPLLEI